MRVPDETTLLPMKELFRQIDLHPVRRAYIPVESQLSWPLPVRYPGKEKLYLAAFFYPSPVVVGRPRQVYRPTFQITIDPEDGRMCMLVDCRFQDFAPGMSSGPILGEARNEDLPAPTISEIERLREDLFASYDRVLPLAFQPSGLLTPGQLEGLGRFRQLFFSMAGPLLLPFYQALSPGFFAWLDQLNGAA